MLKSALPRTDRGSLRIVDYIELELRDSERNQAIMPSEGVYLPTPLFNPGGSCQDYSQTLHQKPETVNREQQPVMCPSLKNLEGNYDVKPPAGGILTSPLRPLPCPLNPKSETYPVKEPISHRLAETLNQ